MSEKRRKILDSNRINDILIRMAHQVFESNFGAKELIFVGIGTKGFELAKRIAEHLLAIDSSMSVELIKMNIDKAQPIGTIKLKPIPAELEGKDVIIVDDVLNTGKTLAYAMMPFLEQSVKKIEVIILVDRGHRLFPVSATFSGYSLPTTLEEHIEVRLGKSPAVFLY